MARAADGAELDALVARVLAAFDLAECEQDARWRRQLRDLRRIIAADYRGTVRTLHRRGIFPARSLIGDVARDFPDFNVRPLALAAAFSVAPKLRIRLRLQEYAQQLPLRGFYHRVPSTDAVIWVNTAHHPGAVAASLGHELGHWYRERLLGSAADGTSIPFLNANFANHLTQPDELFADLFVLFAAYPTAVAARMFSPRGWRGAVTRMTQFDSTTLKRIRRHLTSYYGFDAHRRNRLKTPRRIYYVTSMLHFARLRWAVLQELDV